MARCIPEAYGGTAWQTAILTGQTGEGVHKILCILIIELAMLSACTTSDPLPTRAVIATVPNITPTKPSLPPTYSPSFTVTAAPTNIPVAAITTTPTPCAKPGRIEMGTFPSQTADSNLYRIYLPPCYEGNGRFYPTLYMLPGNNQTDAIWDELGIDEIAETTIQNGNMPPFLIVMPDGGELAHDSSGGSGSYETVIIEDLIKTIEENYCAWPNTAGRAIGGLSRGGYWALEIAFRHPAQFASVGGHSAALLDIAAGPDINPQYTALKNDLGDLRIYLDIGEEDGGIENTRKLHEDMDLQNISHTWVLNDGGHDNIYWTTHLLEYLNWYTSPWPLNRDDYPTCPQK